jgi:hypothetical protein
LFNIQYDTNPRKGKETPEETERGIGKEEHKKEVKEKSKSGKGERNHIEIQLISWAFPTKQPELCARARHSSYIPYRHSWAINIIILAIPIAIIQR